MWAPESLALGVGGSRHVVGRPRPRWGRPAWQARPPRPTASTKGPLSHLAAGSAALVEVVEGEGPRGKDDLWPPASCVTHPRAKPVAPLYPDSGPDASVASLRRDPPAATSHGCVSSPSGSLKTRGTRAYKCANVCFPHSQRRILGLPWASPFPRGDHGAPEWCSQIRSPTSKALWAAPAPLHAAVTLSPRSLAHNC